MFLEESFSRARAFTDAGAHVLSIDSLVSREEMKSFCNVYPLVPKLVTSLCAFDYCYLDMKLHLCAHLLHSQNNEESKTSLLSF